MNNKSDTVTCSFILDRNTYNAYKSIIVANGENVKGNIVNYMESVIEFKTPNAETILAIKEVQYLKANSNKKTCSCFDEILAELDDD